MAYRLWFDGRVIRGGDVDGLRGRARASAVLALSTAVILATLDAVVVNTTLPSIARDLAISGAAAIWAVNAYQLSLIATLLPLAALGESIGPKRVHLAGLLGFTLASIACALAPSLPLLIAARLIQGLGAAAIISVNTVLVRLVHPARLLGRGLGFNALVGALAFTAGPFVASLVLSVGSWRWLFVLNLPLGLLSLILSARFLPARRVTTRFDGAAAFLAAAAFGMGFFAFAGAAHDGSAHVPAISLFAALTCAALLIARQARHPAPILAFDLFRHGVFALSAATSTCAFAAQSMAFVALPFLLQGVIGRSAIETGLLMAPWPAAAAGMTLISGRLADRAPVNLLGAGGLLILACGLTSFAIMSSQASVASITFRMFLCGAAFGVFQAPNLKALMTTAPVHRAAGASGVAAIARHVGQGVGTGLVALCLNRFPASGAMFALYLSGGFAFLGSLCSLGRTQVRVAAWR